RCRARAWRRGCGGRARCRAGAWARGRVRLAESASYWAFLVRDYAIGPYLITFVILDLAPARFAEAGILGPLSLSVFFRHGTKEAAQCACIRAVRQLRPRVDYAVNPAEPMIKSTPPGRSRPVLPRTLTHYRLRVSRPASPRASPLSAIAIAARSSSPPCSHDSAIRRFRVYGHSPTYRAAR